eukprot:6206258-Pleurochrysis_carterae.AAC.1
MRVSVAARLFQWPTYAEHKQQQQQHKCACTQCLGYCHCGSARNGPGCTVPRHAWQIRSHKHGKNQCMESGSGSALCKSLECVAPGGGTLPKRLCTSEAVYALRFYRFDFTQVRCP